MLGLGFDSSKTSKKFFGWVELRFFGLNGESFLGDWLAFAEFYFWDFNNYSGADYFCDVWDFYNYSGAGYFCNIWDFSYYSGLRN